MKLVWSANAWEDYLHWQPTDRDTPARIDDLIKASLRTPFAGIGKAEPLRAISKGGGHAGSRGNTASSIA